MRFSLLPSNQRQFARTMSMVALAACNKNPASSGDTRPMQSRVETQRPATNHTSVRNALAA